MALICCRTLSIRILFFVFNYAVEHLTSHVKVGLRRQDEQSYPDAHSPPMILDWQLINSGFLSGRYLWHVWCRIWKKVHFSEAVLATHWSNAFSNNRSNSAESWKRRWKNDWPQSIKTAACSWLPTNDSWRPEHLSGLWSSSQGLSLWVPGCVESKSAFLCLSSKPPNLRVFIDVPGRLVPRKPLEPTTHRSGRIQTTDCLPDELGKDSFRFLALVVNLAPDLW